MKSYTISDEEFEKMISELTKEDIPCFDALCSIAEQTLRRYITRLCKGFGFIGHEDDVMQEIFCKLIQTCVTHFLKKDVPEGELNRDKNYFKNWLFTVARNTGRNYFEKHNHYSKTKKKAVCILSIEDFENLLFANDTAELDLRIDIQKLLLVAFHIAVDSDKKIYMVLTWMAVFLVFFTMHTNKKESIGLVEKVFSERPLFDLRQFVFETVDKIPWLAFTTKQKDRIEQALLKSFKDQNCYGKMQYKYFFGKRGGKAAISDWVYRINQMIVSRMNHGTFDD